MKEGRRHIQTLERLKKTGFVERGAVTVTVTVPAVTVTPPGRESIPFIRIYYFRVRKLTVRAGGGGEGRQDSIAKMQKQLLQFICVLCFCITKKITIISPSRKRLGAEEAHRAHNPRVRGSKPRVARRAVYACLLAERS